MDIMNFFASDKDLSGIFRSVEKDIDIKYTIMYAYTETGKRQKPQTEFDTIDEVIGNFEAGYDRKIWYLIGPKSEKMDTWPQVLESENRERYITHYCDNKNCILLTGGAKYPNWIGDYQVQIARQYGSQFADDLFKRVVKEIRKNCVKIKAISPFYVSSELYQHKENYIFYGMRFAFPQIVTEACEGKRWWLNPNVREFMDRPITEHLQFLKDIFVHKELQDLDCNNRTERYEVYEGILYKLSINQDLSIIKDIAVLFDDNVNIASPLYITKSIMEELKDIIIELAYSHKREGFKILLENLKNIPNVGYDCGKKELIITLFKKKYYETFKESLSDAAEDTKMQIKEILGNISNKRLQGQVNEVIGLL